MVILAKMVAFTHRYLKSYIKYLPIHYPLMLIGQDPHRFCNTQVYLFFHFAIVIIPNTSKRKRISQIEKILLLIVLTPRFHKNHQKKISGLPGSGPGLLQQR